MAFPPSLPRALFGPVGGLLVLVLLAGVLLVPAPAAEATEVRGAAAPDDTPLAVTITTMTPAVLPRRGRITLSGTVTNNDDSTWSDVNLYSFMGPTAAGTGVATPLTTQEEIAAAAATAPDEYVGERITEPGDFATIPQLEPGASAPYTFRVPVRDLPQPAGEGVYWFGVHALGADDAGRDGLADGRARTFLPMLKPRRDDTPVRTAFVVPLRKRILREANGAIADPEEWTRTLTAGGRLSDLVDAALTAQGEATLLVDPAVVDAVHDLAAGNPARDLGPTVPAEDAPADGGEPSPDRSPAPEEGPPGERPSPEPDPETTAAAEAATAWLERWRQAAGASQVLALPYGDLDLTAAAEHAPGLYDLARERSQALFEEWGIEAQPVDAPYSGFTTADALDLGGDDGREVPVLLTDRAYPGVDLGVDVPAEPEESGSATPSTGDAVPSDPTPTAGVELPGGQSLESPATDPETDPALGTTVPPVIQAGGRRVVLASAGAAAGGAEPGDLLGPVSLRQRILAEAAVRLLAGERTLVVSMPPGWKPSRPEEMLGAFQDGGVPWLDLTPFGGTTVEPAVALDPAVLQVPQTERALSSTALSATERLMAAGRSLQRVLTRNDRVAREVEDEALTSASYTARGGTGAAADLSRAWIQDKLDDVRIESSRRVTLASDHGRFAATVINDLPEPVTVRIHTSSDGDLQIDVEEEIQVGAEGRTTVLLSARASRNGVHNVTLALTDSEGNRIGSSAQVPIRVGEVSRIIWLFLLVGAALLFGAIGVRLVRRIRGRGAATPADAAEEEGPPARSDESTVPTP